MEVREGYKQTEVGIIPKDWIVKKLGEIAPISTGNTPPTNDPKNYGDEFLFVSPVDLGTEKFISRTEKMLSKKGFSISRPFPKGSILFVCIGSTIGKCGIASKTLTSNQQINAVFPSTGTSFDYLYYALVAVSPKVKSLAGEQAVPIVNKTQFSETLVALPTLTEQEAIAEALSDTDALIEALEQLIAKKRQVKESVKEELLTRKIRLPGFIEEWKEKTIGEIAIVTDFSANGSFADLRTNVKYMSAPDYAILVRLVDFSNKWSGDFVYVPKYSYDFLKKSKLSVGDLVISNIGYAGILFQVPDLGMPMTLGPNALVIKTDDYPNTSREYLYHYLSSVDGQNRIRFIITQSAQPKFNKTDFRNMQIPFPKKEEQTAIAKILSDMDAEIAALEEKLSKARQVKQGMMSVLLTGRVRLV